MMMCLKNSVVGSCLMLIVFTCWINANRSEAFGTFGFDIHHRYSDTVKQFLNIDGLPEEGTADYYSAMAHRDRHLMSRHLSATSPPLTFFGDNRTYNIWELRYLHYSLVRVGTPALTFLVALDTTSNLFWLPCDCTTCARYFNWSDGTRFEFDIYSPSNSTTSAPLPCSSTMCGPTRGCSAKFNACSYQQLYGNASSTGILVDDVLHLGTDTNPQEPVDATVTFGCGKNQTGNFLNSINGVFGLGMGSISVPSVLAKKNVTSNSFSLCFPADGDDGRIEFGDKGSADQNTTPFNLQQSNPTYNITVTQIAVGDNMTNLEFAATFNSAVRYTYFDDPAYSFITNNFNSRITEKPYHYPFDFILDYCYAISPAQGRNYAAPNLTFTMKGGSQFNVTAPTILFKEDDGYVFCLAIVKSEGINIIGHNFMTGYRLVFDRDEMVLGWKECTYSITSNIPPQRRPRPVPQQAPPPPPPPSKNGVARLSSMTSGLMAVVLGVLSHNIIVLSS